MAVNGPAVPVVTGSKPAHDRPWAFALLALVLGGCSVPAPPPAPDPPARPGLAARHDPSRCGVIHVRVVWAGPVPVVSPLLGAVPAGEGYGWVSRPNPFAPVVDTPTGGLAHVLVYLNRVDPAAGKPWDIPPVTLTARDFGWPVRAAVVRTGDALTVASADSELHAVRGRGADFFTLPLVETGRPTWRVLTKPGVVELSSGAGYYWLACDLFVTDTPYAAVTAADGTATLSGVPAGAYDIACRVRDWHAAAAERDPETGLTFRQSYRPAVVATGRVVVPPGGAVTHDWSFTAAQFGP